MTDAFQRGPWPELRVTVYFPSKKAGKAGAQLVAKKKLHPDRADDEDYVRLKTRIMVLRLRLQGYENHGATQVRKVKVQLDGHRID